MYKSICKSAALIVFASVIFTLFRSPPFALLTWIDALFMVSLFVTIVMAIFYIIQQGFFDRFIANFKYVMQNLNKARQAADQIERKEAYLMPHRYPFISPWLTAGCMMLFISILLSIIL